MARPWNDRAGILQGQTLDAKGTEARNQRHMETHRNTRENQQPDECANNLGNADYVSVKTRRPDEHWIPRSLELRNRHPWNGCATRQRFRLSNIPLGRAHQTDLCFGHVALAAAGRSRDPGAKSLTRRGKRHRYLRCERIPQVSLPRRHPDQNGEGEGPYPACWQAVGV